MTDLTTDPLEAEFDRFMDATQTVIQLKPGELTAEQVAEIQFAFDYERRDQDDKVDVFHQGYKHGVARTVGAEKAALIEQVDDLQSELRTMRALTRYFGATQPDVPAVFLDCDGVLADFDSYAEAYFGMNPRAYEAKVGSAKFWEMLEAKGDFYRDLPLMADAKALYEGVRHLSPTILTGCPRGDWAEAQKVAWAAEHFPGVPIITCRSSDKRAHAKAGDVLIDDWHQHRHRWIEMGGVFITHTDAQTSLAALWAHYPQLQLAAVGAS